jgi:glycosyltransferase involved in cell wall biosynthesis
MATVGREAEVEHFLSSIGQQDFDLSRVEIIVVDQNTRIDLAPVIARFSAQLNILHVRSDRVGLSFNRNLGLASARGQILAFPDDDCTYYPDTLNSVEKVFLENAEAAVLIGRVYDRKRAANIIREWPSVPKQITRVNFFTHYTAITLFSKFKAAFDESLGIGTQYGSYEDADYVVRILKEGRPVLFHPAVEVWHPPLNLQSMSPSKVVSYGMGFGALCRKHFGWILGSIFIIVLGVHFSKLLLAIVTFNGIEIRKRSLAIRSRLKGFVLYHDA